MSRENLYRGKRKDNGEWVEGSLLQLDFPRTETYIVDRFATIECDNIDGMEYVIPETVGQFTGLTDKNGKKIFEGDIVGCFCNTQIFEIKYCEERCGYFLDNTILCGGVDPAPECLGNMRNTVEVIGNIYDNPELLEVKE